MDAHRQAWFEHVEDLLQLLVVAVGHHHGRRPEALRGEGVGVGQQLLRGHLEELGPGSVGRPVDRHENVGAGLAQLGAAGVVPLGDLVVQQRLRRGRRDRVAQRVVQAVLLREQQQPGLGAELARTHREGCGEAGRDLVTAAGRGCRGDQHRVDAPELAVERDRPRARGGDVEQRSACADRTGEGGGLDARVLQRCDADVLTVDQPEGSLRCSRVRQSGRDDLGDPVREAGMAGVRLHHDRASRSQRGRGVATGDAEGEGEVARGEHQHRADRGHHPAQIRPSPHRPVLVRVVDGRRHPAAVRQDLGEQPELERRARQLPLQAGIGREVALLGRERHQLLGMCVQRVGNRAQPGGALPWFGGAERLCRVGGCLEYGVQGGLVCRVVCRHAAVLPPSVDWETSDVS